MEVKEGQAILVVLVVVEQVFMLLAVVAEQVVKVMQEERQVQVLQAKVVEAELELLG